MSLFSEIFGIFSLDGIKDTEIKSYLKWLKKFNIENTRVPKEACCCLLLSKRQLKVFSLSGNASFSESVIYNRNDLLDLPANTDSTKIGNDEILSSGFEKYGNDFFKYINGSFFFLNINARNRILTASSGYDGTNSLFYYSNSGYIVFSSRLKNLLEFPEIPADTDNRQIASILNCLPLNATSTCFKYIKRLPPGHVLTYSASGIRVNQYWKLDDIREVRFKTDREYTECFLDFYRNAVKTRIRNNEKTGTFLSGGIDSGTIAALAAEILAEKGEYLYSYTSVPAYNTLPFLSKSRFGDERTYVNILCKKYPNISCKYLDSKSISPVDGIIESLEMLYQPMHAAGNMFWIHDIYRNARKDSIRTLFTGQHGNMTVSFAGFRNNFNGILDFIKNHYYGKLYYGKNILEAYLRYFAPEMILSIIRKSRRSLQHTADWRNFSAINPKFAETVGISEIQPFTEENFRKKNPRYILFENSYNGVDADFAGCCNAEYGFETTDPTFDRKLLEFCFSIPDSQYKRYGITRFLIRRSFNEKMPKEILWNRTRGAQAADISMRVRDEYSRINNILKRFQSSDSVREILDIDKMLNILNRVLTERTPVIARQTGAILLRGLMVGLFLIKQEGDKKSMAGPADYF